MPEGGEGVKLLKGTTHAVEVGRATDLHIKKGFDGSFPQIKIGGKMISQAEAAAREKVSARVRLERARKSAYIDPVTGLNNKFWFDRQLTELFDKAKEEKSTLDAMFIDLDYFKDVNLSEGHNGGNAVLNLAGKLISSVINTGVLVRWGGDEFAVLLQGDTNQSAYAAASIIRLFREKAPLTCSIGVSTMTPEQPFVDPETLIDAANSAMLIAKETGRDKVVIWNRSIPIRQRNKKK